MDTSNLEGPNLNGPKKTGILAFIGAALATLAQIWDNITGASSSPPPEPQENQNESCNPFPSSSDVPSFVPDYNKMKTETE
jgi:hypothetical protein